MSKSDIALTAGQELRGQILGFLVNLEDLRDFLEVVSHQLDSVRKNDFGKDPDAWGPYQLLWNAQFPEANFLTKEQQNGLMSKYGDDVKIVESLDEKGGKIFELQSKGDIGRRVQEAAKIIEASIKRWANLNNSALISLISACELFAGQLLHYFFAKFPQAASLKEKNFSFEELSTFSSIDEARKYLVDNKVEEILRGNFKDWISFFETKINISTELVKEHIPYCQEACLRRNLLVHNGGIVNQVHIKKLPDELGEKPAIGNRLVVSEEYFSDRLDRFEVLFFVLALEVWKKFSKEDEGRGKVALEYGYKALERKRWSVAKVLCKHVIDEHQFAEDLRMYAQVNYWQSYKWSGEFETVRQKITTWDVSAKSTAFQAAKAALLDQDEIAIKLLKIMKERNEIQDSELHEWPLFTGLRERGALNELIKDEKRSE